jgi:hypothetical protein
MLYMCVCEFSGERSQHFWEKKKRRAKNLTAGMVRLVRRRGGRGGDLILQTKPWLGFRRGDDGWCVGTNEWMGSVRLGRWPYMFTQGTWRNGQMTSPRPLLCCIADKRALITAVPGVCHITYKIATGNHSGNEHITSSARCYYDPHKQRA